MINFDITPSFNSYKHAEVVIGFYRAYCGFSGHFTYLEDRSPLRKALAGGGWEPETPVVHLKSRPNKRQRHVPRSGAI